jgi:hypothetical protein
MRKEKARAALKALKDAHRSIGKIPGDHAARIIREMREGR